MNKRTDERRETDGGTGLQTNSKIDGRAEGRREGREGRTDGWMVGWMDGWTGGINENCKMVMVPITTRGGSAFKVIFLN